MYLMQDRDWSKCIELHMPVDWREILGAVLEYKITDLVWKYVYIDTIAVSEIVRNRGLERMLAGREMTHLLIDGGLCENDKVDSGF